MEDANLLQYPGGLDQTEEQGEQGVSGSGRSHEEIERGFGDSMELDRILDFWDV